MQGWRWALAQLTRRLWLRASVFGLAGVAVALLAAALSPFVPRELAKPFGGGAVDGLLNMLATSLLAVATFSTAAMLSAYTNVSQLTTPRAAALITADSRAQTSLSTFVGAFLYSVVAVSALGTGYYGAGGRAILFAVTIAMLVWVAVTLLRWLDQLLDLARVPHAIDKVEAAARGAIEGRFGAALDPAGWTEPPAGALEIAADEVGYVANVDVERLRKLSRAHGLELWVASSPGAFTHPGRALLRVRVDHALAPGVTAALREAFAISDQRSFDQDPRFGFVVLGEAAAKALSPAVNDPGAAIDVVGTAVRLLSAWRRLAEARAACEPANGVHLRPPTYAELLDDVFRPVAHYGAGDVAVVVRLLKGLAALRAEARDVVLRSALEATAADAAARALAALAQGVDKDRVRVALEEAVRGCEDPA